MVSSLHADVTLSRGAAKPSKKKPYPTATWENDELVADLRQMWLEGVLSVSQIAACLWRKHKDFLISQGVDGMTSGMITGKASRIGLGKKPTRICGPRPYSRRKPEKEKVQPAVIAAELPVTTKDLFVPQAERVELLALKDSMCRWPLGDPRDANFGFCGCRTGGSTYCEYHSRIAYQPVQRRQAPQGTLVTA